MSVETTEEEVLDFNDDNEEVDELRAVPIETGLEVFKRHISTVFDIDPKLVESLQVREGLEVSISDVPTRRERMGYEWIPTAEDRKRHKSVPKWAQEVQCPKCGAIMVPLRSKGDTKFGENVTYQCHRFQKGGEPCLLVMTVMTGTYYMMRPGDFTKSDWDWTRVAQGSVPIIPGMKVVEANEEDDFVKPVAMPPNPWTKGRTQSKTVWNEFWRIMLEDGEVGIQELKDAVIAIRKQDASGKFAYKLDESINTIPSWIFRRTGYVIKAFGGTLRVVGKSRGDISRYPFSDPDYRRLHRF